MTVKINDDTLSQLKARVIATEPQANTTTRNIMVRALLENGKANPGSFVKVLIENANNNKSVLVPTSAIIPEDLNKSLVTVKNGKAVYVKVETGSRAAASIAITKGIAEGDTIVVTGVLFTKPNAPVKVRSVKNLTDFD